MTLHNHLESKHTLLYLDVLQEQCWQPQSPLIKAAIKSGYTFKTLREALNSPSITLDNIPPPPPQEDGDDVPAGLGPQSKADLNASIPEFSLRAFHQYLVDFIVANNQVMKVF